MTLVINHRRVPLVEDRHVVLIIATILVAMTTPMGALAQDTQITQYDVAATNFSMHSIHERNGKVWIPLYNTLSPVIKVYDVATNTFDSDYVITEKENTNWDNRGVALNVCYRRTSLSPNSLLFMSEIEPVTGVFLYCDEGWGPDQATSSSCLALSPLFSYVPFPYTYTSYADWDLYFNCYLIDADDRTMRSLEFTSRN